MATDASSTSGLFNLGTKLGDPVETDASAVTRDTISISSPDELEKWLADKPVEWAQMLLRRMELRRFPMFLDAEYSKETGIDAATRMATWRIELTRSLYIGREDTELRDAELSAWEDYSNARKRVIAGYEYADRVIASFRSPDDTFERERAATAAANFEIVLGVTENWQSLERDMSILTGFGNGREAALALFEVPLWPIDIEGIGATDPSIPRWASEPLDAFERQAWEEKSSWKLIVDWYRALLPDPPDQKPHQYLGERASIAIATQPNEFWTVSDDRSPDIIMDDVVRVARENGATWDPIAGVQFTDPAETEENTEAPDAPETPGEIDKFRYDTDLTDDRPEGDEDHLGRADIAFMLASRLQQIWDGQNRPNDQEPTPSFVVHIDAPWGGGKTTFANYLIRILNPHMNGNGEEIWKKALPREQLDKWRDENPWHIVWYNAWQKQHVRPPWWTFYRGFLKQTLGAVWHSRFNKNDRFDYVYGANRGGLDGIDNKWFWLDMWFWEYLWRLWVPENRVRFAAGAVSLCVFLALWSADALVFAEPQGASAGGWRWAGDIAGLLAIATFAWSTFGTFAQSLFIGTPDAADNYSLGAGDPLQHFKKRYDRFCRELQRPILVVVDDLDRCEPAFVTELLTGFQTVLASPRVVILLLGDKDWLEESFAQSNKSMKQIDVGPEHSFGGRFVEKVIQLSITLPEIDDEARRVYLHELLDVDDRPEGRERTEMPTDGPVGNMQAQGEALSADAKFDPIEHVLSNQSLSIDEVRQIGRAVLETPGGDRESQAFNAVDAIAAKNAAIDPNRLGRSVARLVAMQSSADVEKEKQVRHQLSGLASVLPPNPRQIKRIVNTVALISGVALSEKGIRENTPQWRKLARWIVLMIEWPQTWYTMTHNPQIADQLDEIWNNRSPRDNKDGKWATIINANEDARKLLQFSWKNMKSDWTNEQAITVDDIVEFADIMPATSGTLLPLPKPKKPEPNAESDAEEK